MTLDCVKITDFSSPVILFLFQYGYTSKPGISRILKADYISPSCSLGEIELVGRLDDF